MRVLVTGGAGFIGSHTVGILTAHNHSVMVYDDFSTGSVENFEDIHCTISPYSILDEDHLDIVFDEFRPEAVIHLAAQSAITTSMNDPVLDIQKNVIGTVNVVKYCRKYDVRRLVFSSTSAVYAERKTLFGMKETFDTHPQSPYGIDKLAAEQFIRTMFPDHVIFRYGNVYGPRQKPIGENQVVARAMEHIINNADFKIVGSGNQKRDFVYVEDVAYANMLAVLGSATGTFNLCTGKSTSVNQVISILSELCYVQKEAWKHTKKEDPRGSVYTNNGKFVEWSGMRFLPIEEGLEKTVGHYMKTR